MERPARIGRYELLGEVARGGMGAVHRARGPDGRPVALKLLLAGAAASPLQRRRMVNEVQALLRIRHPGVVALLDAGEHGASGPAAEAAGARVPYVVMEWIEGETLETRLARDGPLPWPAAVELVHRLAAAVEHCHAQGVLHRDLKPANVMLRAGDGAPLLTDFGLAADAEGRSAVSTAARTRDGWWLGTPGWWPPEQARGDLSGIGPRADVYGLGAVLFAALTGLPPQNPETLAEAIAGHPRPPVPPSRVRPGIPPWLDSACLRALAVDPAGRPASAAELARDLAGAGRPPRRPASRLATPVAAAILALGGLGAAVVVRWKAPPSPTAPIATAPIAPAPIAPAPHPPMPAASPTIAPPGAPHATGPASPGPAPDDGPAPEPRSAGAFFERGLARANRGRFREAIADFDRVIALDPRFALAWANRGVAREELGELPEAVADLDQAVALDPHSADAFANRSGARAGLGRLEEAIADCDLALQIDPRHALAWANRGIAHERQGLLREAVGDFDQAVACEPRYADAYASRGFVRAQLGMFQEAIADYDRAIALTPHPRPAWAEQVRAAREQARAGLLRR